MLSFRSIPPGVLHLHCVIVTCRKRLVDDDTAPEVQTNFISSQNLAMIVYFVISTMLLPFLPAFVCWRCHACSVVHLVQTIAVAVAAAVVLIVVVDIINMVLSSTS